MQLGSLSKDQQDRVAVVLLAETENLPGDNNFKVTTINVLIEKKKEKIKIHLKRTFREQRRALINLKYQGNGKCHIIEDKFI